MRSGEVISAEVVRVDYNFVVVNAGLKSEAFIPIEEFKNDNGEIVAGTITGKVKGGLTVLTNGIRAFLPGSLVDTRPVKDTTPYEGKTLEF